MSRHKSFILLLTLLLGLWEPLKAHVDLDYPLGGETFIEGQTIHIEWHIVAFHETLNWDLLFSSNGGVDWTPIQMDIIYDSLGYTWVVPSTFSSQCRVRVIQDNTGQDYWGTSTDFTIVPDMSPPTLDAPAEDALIECDIATQGMTLQAWLDNHGGAVVTNHCDNLVWTNDYDGLSNGCGATGSALVVFTATDDCGSTYTVAEVTIADNQPPAMNLSPIDLVVQCNGQGNASAINQWLSNHGGAQASDACGNIIWTHNMPTIDDSCGVSSAILVTFLATDECGNSVSATASFIIQDTSGLLITTPAQDAIIDCSTTADQAIQQWLYNHGGAQASGPCGGLSWVHNFSGLTLTCGGSGNASVTFTATDDCGHIAITIATVTVQDTLAPVGNAEAQAIVFQCGDPEIPLLIQNWLDQHGGAQASDECGSVSWANNYTGLSDDCGTSGSASVIFTATDECGNSSTTSANIHVIDTIPPVIETAAMDTTIYCGSPDLFIHVLQWLDRHAGAEASDLCSPITWIDDFILSLDSCVAGTYPVTFTAFDECLNINTTSANLSTLDTLSTLSTSLSKFDLNVYPNPAIDWLTVDLGGNENLPAKVSLIDVCGKIVWTDKAESVVIRIPVGHFAAGVYFLKVELKLGSYTRMFVISR